GFDRKSPKPREVVGNLFFEIGNHHAGYGKNSDARRQSNNNGEGKCQSNKRRLSQLRLSREREDLLKARIKLTIPLVEKKVANTKPKESKPLFWFLIISSKVDSTTI